MALLENMSVIDLVDAMSNQFTNVDWKIGQFMASHPSEFCSMTAAEIANSAGVSDASVIRFAQKIGFDGFQELRSRFKRELAGAQDAQNETKGDLSPLHSLFSQTLSMLFESITAESTDTFVSLADSCDTVLVCGSGRIANLAQIVAMKLMLLKIKAQPITDPNMMNIQASFSDKKTLFLLLDVSGDTEALTKAATMARAQGSMVATISRHHDSSLKDISATYLFIPSTAGKTSSPSISIDTLTMLVVDILFDSIIKTKHDEYFELLQKTGGLLDTMGAEIVSSLTDPLFSL